VRKYRDSNAITVKGNNVPHPSQYFEEGNFPDYVMREILYVRFSLLYLFFSPTYVLGLLNLMMIITYISGNKVIQNLQQSRPKGGPLL